jgi:hypothetical protein
MQQIKTFQSGEDWQVNEWLNENPNIKISLINRMPMYDRHSWGQGDICNQWVDIVVVYEEN